jgi:hypothetical protein
MGDPATINACMLAELGIADDDDRRGRAVFFLRALANG